MAFTLQIPGRWLLIGWAVVMAVGCAGNPSRAWMPSEAAAADARTQNQLEPQPAASAATSYKPLNLEHRLRSEVRQWEGTPPRIDNRRTRPFKIDLELTLIRPNPWMTGGDKEAGPFGLLRLRSPERVP
jgi:hypothetical protein